MLSAEALTLGHSKDQYSRVCVLTKGPWSSHHPLYAWSFLLAHVYWEKEELAGLDFQHCCLVFLFLLELQSLRSAAPERARPRLCADLSLAAFHNDELLLRRGPGEHNLCVVFQNVIQLLGSHVLQIASVYYTGPGIPTIRTKKKKTHTHTHKTNKGHLSVPSSPRTKVLSLCSNVLVAQWYPAFCNPMGCSPPSSSVHEILQARVLEWVAISSSRGSSRPRDQTQASGTVGEFFTVWVTRAAKHHKARGNCSVK